jgi:hypothetical protein
VRKNRGRIAEIAWLHKWGGGIMDMPITVSRRVTQREVKSVIELDKFVFHVTSFFNETESLTDLLFTAASENLFTNPFLGSDISPCPRYNGCDD